MRLDAAEVANLPLPAALVDRDGGVIGRTPEWRGAPPGSLSYRHGAARLLISPGDAARPEQEAVMRRLLDELASAVSAMDGDEARRAAVLACSLELVAGGTRSAGGSGTASEVLDLARAAIGARAPDAAVRVEPARPDPAVPAPAQIALALVQFAVNAAVHDGASRIRLRAGLGPSFFVEWPSTRTAALEVGGRRHPRLRERWGLGYVRTVADALGATPLPPAPTAPGWSGACLSLGSPRLTLPLAVLAGTQVVVSTQTWQQEVANPLPGTQSAVGADLAAVLAAAAAKPGAIARGELLAARHVAGRTWVALPPDTGAERAGDVLRGLDHERALWSAPGPHAVRIHGLIAVLARSLGTAPRAFAPEAFAREFPRACRALGVAPPEVGPALSYPDPRLTAFLLSELGGLLRMDPPAVRLTPHPRALGSPLLPLLGAGRDGGVQLTPHPEYPARPWS